MQTGQVGIIKVAYTRPGDKQLHSKMFDSVKDALPFITGKQNALIFQLAKNSGDTYDWELLPFGNYRAYKFGMFIKNNLLEILLLLVGLGFAIKYTLDEKGIRLFVRGDNKAASSTPTPSNSTTEPPPVVEQSGSSGSESSTGKPSDNNQPE